MALEQELQVSGARRTLFLGVGVGDERGTRGWGQAGASAITWRLLGAGITDLHMGRRRAQRVWETCCSPRC